MLSKETLTPNSDLKTPKPNTKEALDRLLNEVEALLATLGYEAVSLEQSSAPTRQGRILTLFIDFLNNDDESRRISLDDCVTVNTAVDEIFETTPLLDGAYTLEVSSPGVERPLRKARDYERFSGRKARLHTFRPLDSDELENAAYWQTHQKQKNFVGKLEGLSTDETKAKMAIDGQTVTVPLELVSKAHLEFSQE